GHNLAPIADPAVAGPDFLAVNNVMVAIEPGFGLQVGEIGAGVGFGKPLAPDFLSAQNFRDETFFLRFGAVGNNRGADQTKPEGIGHGRRFGARHLLPKNGLLHYGGAAPAKFLGPE